MNSVCQHHISLFLNRLQSLLFVHDSFLQNVTYFKGKTHAIALNNAYLKRKHAWEYELKQAPNHRGAGGI